MKKMLILAVALLLAAPYGAFAETTTPKTFTPTDKAAAQKAFEQLKKNTQKGLLAPNAIVQSKFVAIDPVELQMQLCLFPSLDDVAGVPETPTPPADPVIVAGITSGMKIWFELPDGRLADPSAYRFSPNEVFFMHVEAAVPVYVALYQNFPDKQETAQVYPVERFPSSYRILEAGKGTKLPVMFKMDDNYEAEHMAVVVARADWEEITKDVPDSAATAVALAQAATPDEYAAVYRNIAKGQADISSPTVLTKFAAFAEFDWNEEVEVPVPVPVPVLRGPEERTASVESEEAEEQTATAEPVVSEEQTAAAEPATAEETVVESAATEELAAATESVEEELMATTCVSVWDGTGKSSDDVALYLFSQMGIGHMQVVLQKVDPVLETGAVSVTSEAKPETEKVETVAEEKVETEAEEKAETEMESEDDVEVTDISTLTNE